MKGLPAVHGQVQPDADDEGVHRRRPPGGARLRRDRHGGGGRQRPARLLQGRGEVGPHVPGHRRRALLLPGRPGHGERGRLAQPPRPGQPGDQHRRREGVPGGGRGGDQAGRQPSTTAWSSGLPDDRFGEAVTAVVSLTPGATTDESAIITEVKQHLAGYKAPKRVVFVAQVPRAPNGKADYRTAREQALASG